MEFDIWADEDGFVTSRIANKRFVDDCDAPYGYSKHILRISAETRKAAMRKYRKINQG